MKKADDLRAQARELLKQAEAVDGKQMWTVALGGSDLDAPLAMVIWSATEPSEQEACKATDTDADAVANGDIEMSIKQLPLSGIFPEVTQTKKPQRSPSPGGM